MSTYKYKEAGHIICESSAEIRTQSNKLFLLVEDFDDNRALLKPDSSETERINQLLEQLMDITAALDIIGHGLRLIKGDVYCPADESKYWNLTEEIIPLK